MYSEVTIRKAIESSLKGSKVIVENTRGDHEHFQAIVTFKGFKGKTLVEQHRMVYQALDKEFKEGMHSLSLKTKVE